MTEMTDAEFAEDCIKNNDIELDIEETNKKHLKVHLHNRKFLAWLG